MLTEHPSRDERIQLNADLTAALDRSFARLGEGLPVAMHDLREILRCADSSGAEPPPEVKAVLDKCRRIVAQSDEGRPQ